MIADKALDNATLQATKLAQCLKAAGDPMRLQILHSLALDSFGVLELAQIFNIKQNAMSHHLKVLATAGLLTTRREGNTIFYRRSDSELSPALANARQAVFAASDHIELGADQHQNRLAIYEQRAAASKAFFVRHIHDFSEQQELIASYQTYGPEVAQLLQKVLISSDTSPINALEVGPGNGDFLPELAKHYQHVTALDSASAMLDKARQTGKQNGLENIHYVNADTRYCHQCRELFDGVIINMVLHHTPSPSAVFSDVACAMRAGASLIVCDLAAHDQDWVRDACGDQWLGFDSLELTQWAANSGLSAGLSRHIALRNGFQIHIHQYIKHPLKH